MAEVLPTPTPARRRWRRVLWASAALLGTAAMLALLAFGLMRQAPNRSIDDSLSKSRPAAAPGFDLPVLTLGDRPRSAALLKAAANDGRIRLSELRSHPVILNFWASWCPPCREEAPVLARRWRQDRRRGVIYLGVDERDLTTDARAYLARYGISYPNVRSPDGETSSKWGATGYPETYFISAQGQVVQHVTGVVSPTLLTEGVAAAIRGHPTPPHRGGAKQASP